MTDATVMNSAENEAKKSLLAPLAPEEDASSETSASFKQKGPGTRKKDKMWFLPKKTQSALDSGSEQTCKYPFLDLNICCAVFCNAHTPVIYQCDTSQIQ